MPFDFGTITDYNNPSNNTAVNIANGEPVRVWGIVVTNTNLSNVDRLCVIQTAESTPSTLFKAVVHPDSYFAVRTPFIADKGLQIKNDASGHSDLHYTVIRSHPGT